MRRVTAASVVCGTALLLLLLAAATSVHAAACWSYGGPSQCSLDCACGWCSDDNTCRAGNPNGPTDGSVCTTAGGWQPPDPANCDSCKSRNPSDCVQLGARCSECGTCTNTGHCVRGNPLGPYDNVENSTCGTWWTPNFCPTTRSCHDWDSDAQACLMDCNCGYCSGDPNPCKPATNAGPIPPEACTTAGAWQYTNQTTCDPCLKYFHQSDCIASGSGAMASNCGWCSSANRCQLGSQSGPAVVPSGGCGSWTPPSQPSGGGGGGGGGGGYANCGAATTEQACTSTCGCGWCYTRSACVNVNRATGFPMSESLCPPAFDVHPSFSPQSPECAPRTDQRDPCRDIPPEDCDHVCGCGLCTPNSFVAAGGNNPNIDYSQSVCMAGNATNGMPLGVCPSNYGWFFSFRYGRQPLIGANGFTDPNANNPGSSGTGGSTTGPPTSDGTNPNACVMPTAIPDPCSAYPVDNYGSCELHCGCGRCVNAATGEPICITSRADGTGPLQWGDSAQWPSCRAGSWTAPFGYDAAHVGSDGASTSMAHCRGHTIDNCWRNPQSLCGNRDGIALYDDRNVLANPFTVDFQWDASNLLYREGCVWCTDSNFQGCIPGNPGTTASATSAPATGAITGSSWLAANNIGINNRNGNTFVGRSCRNIMRAPYSELVPRCDQFDSDQSACENACGCGWCGAKFPNHGVQGTCVRLDPWTAKPIADRVCPAPLVMTHHWQTGCYPDEQRAAMQGDSADNCGGNFGCGSGLTTDDKSNLSLVAGCGAVLVATAIWFHWWAKSEESEPTGHPIRLPFPDKSDQQLEQRTCRKFLRLVQLYHPVAMLLYAAQRDGFGRWRRFFCVFVAMSCQLTVTLACLLGLSSAISNAYPGIVSSFISATVSFLYEKPIVRLVKFTARQECCGSCKNCCLASMSYCAIVSCFMQIPIMLIAFWALFIRTGVVTVHFGFTQLMSAWAASVALGYLTQIPSLALRFCLCPAKFTREINEYNRAYEQFDKNELAKLQAAAKAKHMAELAALGGDTNAVVAIAQTPKALPTGATGSTTNGGGTVAAVKGGVAVTPAPASTTLNGSATIVANMPDTTAPGAVAMSDAAQKYMAPGGVAAAEPVARVPHHSSSNSLGGGGGGGAAASSAALFNQQPPPPVMAVAAVGGVAGYGDGAGPEGAVTVAAAFNPMPQPPNTAMVMLDPAPAVMMPGAAPEPQLPVAAAVTQTPPQGLGGRTMSVRRNAFM